MLYGVDISNYQRSVEYSKYAFYIIKASEGRTCKDPCLISTIMQLKQLGSHMVSIIMLVQKIILGKPKQIISYLWSAIMRIKLFLRWIGKATPCDTITPGPLTG